MSFRRKSQFVLRPLDQLLFGLLGLSALIFGCFFFGLGPRASWSHPLGNFSLNHYNSLELHPTAIITQHVLDFAEIPSYNELTRLDTSGDNNVSQQEMRKYKETLRSRFLPGWTLRLKQSEGNTGQLTPEVIRDEVILSQGEGGLTCLQIQMVCIYRTESMGRLEAHQIVFQDRNLTPMRGVREIRLKSYPGVILTPGNIVTSDASIPIARSNDFYVLSGLEVTVGYAIERVADHFRPVLTNTMSLINPASIPKIPLLPDEDENYQILKSPLEPTRGVRAKLSMQSSPKGLDSTTPFYPDQQTAADEIVVPPDPKISEGEDPADSRSSTDINWTNLIATKDLSPVFIILAIGLSVLFGASHALSPGHGKTVVAAYLVGSRGTVKHAVFLGLVVTLTHVAGVFLLGIVTLYFSHYIVPDKLYPIIEAVSGLIIIAIGAALFLKRYAAYQKLRLAENLGINLEGHVHHLQVHGHDHDHRFHHPDDHAHAHHHQHGPGTHMHQIPADVSFKDLLLLGMAGGIVPCPSAIVVLVAAIALHRIVFGMALIVFFSIGLATVLIAIGILMVTAKWLFDRFQNQAKTIRWLQIISPVLVTLLGFAICLRGMQAAGIISFHP